MTEEQGYQEIKINIYDNNFALFRPTNVLEFRQMSLSYIPRYSYIQNNIIQRLSNIYSGE